MARRRNRSPTVTTELEDLDEMMETASIMEKEKELIESIKEAIEEELKSWGIVEEEFKVDIEEHGDIWWTVIPSKEKKGG
jgi:acetylglutamate kinase